VSLYDAVKDLALEIDSYDLTVDALDVSSGFTRKTTTIRLVGAGEEGLGEDVTYEATEHDAQLERGPVLPLTGSWTIDSFSNHLAEQALFEDPPERSVYVDYRRWGFESAALDLALRQNGLDFAEALGREWLPLRFILSLRLGAYKNLADAGSNVTPTAGFGLRIFAFRMDFGAGYDFKEGGVLASGSLSLTF